MKVVHCNDNIVKFKSEQILLILECILSFEHQPPKQKTKKKKQNKKKKKIAVYVDLTYDNSTKANNLHVSQVSDMMYVHVGIDYSLQIKKIW